MSRHAVNIWPKRKKKKEKKAEIYEEGMIFTGNDHYNIIASRVITDKMQLLATFPYATIASCITLSATYCES